MRTPADIAHYATELWLTDPMLADWSLAEIDSAIDFNAKAVIAVEVGIMPDRLRILLKHNMLLLKLNQTKKRGKVN